jgi:hypothetical protein
MSRSSPFLSLLAVFTLLTWLAPGVQAEGKLPPLAAKLKETVKFTGLDDPKTTLQDVLDSLAKNHDLQFAVNDKEFRGEQVEDVLNRPVAEKPLPPITARLDTVLGQVLARVPSASGATFVIRRDYIEITTAAAVQREFWSEGGKGPYLPLIHAAFEKTPLAEALKELADYSDFNVVLDDRVADKAKTAVSARLANVPLDTAVRMLADTADLKPVLMDNTLYVTTRENAERLQKELPKPRKRQPGGLPLGQ